MSKGPGGKLGTSLPSQKVASEVGKVSGKQSAAARSASANKSRASKVGAPRRQVKWGLVATSVFYGLLFFAMAACGVGIYIFANRKPPSVIDPTIQNRYVRACYATSKRRLGASDDYMQHCVKLNYPYHQNCIENDCNKLDFQFNENTGEFQRIEANIETFSPHEQLCDLRTQAKCYQKDEKWMCNDQVASLTYVETALSNVQAPKWVDNCGKPDPCVSITADKFLRQIIYTPDGKLQPADDLLKLSAGISFPPCDGWKDGRIRVRFLRCIFDYRHGGPFCNGSSVRFELSEMCDPSKRLPTDLYYDYEHCGNMANYYYTAGCQVYCLRTFNNRAFHEKTDGRLCQPSPRRFAPFEDQTPDVPADGGRYMCYKTLCVKVTDKDDSIIDGGCEAAKVGGGAADQPPSSP